jgi:predicted Rossmann fold nucleotide-binding protein DprA/Smf involved in DNA uptake
MIDAALSADTQATALLVGHFGEGTAKPLTRTDFNKVAQSLHQRGLRPSDLFRQVPSDLPVDGTRISGLIARGTALALAVESWGRVGIRVVSRGDADYPARFRALLKGASTPILYHAGSLALLERPTVSVVGSRDATEAGLRFARRIGEQAASEQIVTVSGDARGVDRSAMEAALEAGGAVVGILADGLAKSVLSKRYRQALEGGRLLLISHVEPSARFTVAQAMERNRYLYAAADIAIVADSDIKGGTWNGAIENRKHGWAPAYVRTGADAREGNLVLVREGLREIGDGWFDEQRPLASLRIDATEPPAALPLFSASSTTPTTTQTAIPTPALFTLFLDLVASLLRAPLSSAQIADQLGLEPVQAEAWLQQALARGTVTRGADDLWIRPKA